MPGTLGKWATNILRHLIKRFTRIFKKSVLKILPWKGDIEETLNGLDQEDPDLIEAVKKRIIHPDKNVPYNFPDTDVNGGQFGQVRTEEELNTSHGSSAWPDDSTTFSIKKNGDLATSTLNLRSVVPPIGWLSRNCLDQKLLLYFWFKGCHNLRCTSYLK